jgi:hypothetical protein
MHRHDESANLWDKDRTLFKEFYQCLAPFDLKNVRNLEYRHDDARDGDIDWVYSPQGTKGQALVIPAPPRGLLRLLGLRLRARLEVPRPQDGSRPHRRAATAVFTPGSYPADAWQPRKMLLLESTAKDPGHPYGKRVLYVDEQMA